MKISNVFEMMREALGLSQAQIAAEIGVSQATYSRWEQGKTTPRGLAKREWERFVASMNNTNAKGR